jgi:hypothetical protein
VILGYALLKPRGRDSADDVDPIPRLWRRVLEHAVHADDAMQIAERQHDAKPILEDRPCALDRV